MHPAPVTPLGQALAAIIATLIAALAEHAAEHPVLAPGLRATIRRLETLSAKLDALVARHLAGPLPPRRRRGVGDWVLRCHPCRGMSPASPLASPPGPLRPRRHAMRDPPGQSISSKERVFFL